MYSWSSRIRVCKSRGWGGRRGHANFHKASPYFRPRYFFKGEPLFSREELFPECTTLPYKSVGDAGRRTRINPKREQSGRGLGFISTIKKAILQQSMTAFASCGYFSTHNRKWHSMDKDNGFLSRTPWVRPKSAISILKRDDEHPVTLIWEYPLGKTPYPVYQTSSSPDSLPNFRPKARRKPSLSKGGSPGKSAKGMLGLITVIGSCGRLSFGPSGEVKRSNILVQHHGYYTQHGAV